MPKNSSIVAICGAGIAGVALAYYLSKNKAYQKIILIDKGQPLSFTTSKSGENFRNYWPHPCLEQLSTRSIDLMLSLLEEFWKDTFDMRFSGYHFLSHQKEKPIFSNDNSKDFRRQNIVETNPKVIHTQHPYLDKDIQKSIFIKKAGDIDVYALGSLLLRKAKKTGLHIKPESGGKLKIGWAFQRKGVEPQWETHQSDIFPQVVIKGASRLISELKKYEHNLPAPIIEYSGYFYSSFNV